MKKDIQDIIQQALRSLQSDGHLPSEISATVLVERTRDASHGDFASNIALTLAKAANAKPRELAEKIVSALPETEHISKVTIAGPGFINFHLSESAYRQCVANILDQGEQYGKANLGENKKVHIEFVSSNPTGPLHVGHGRGAAYGACVADLLAAVGYHVHREYYLNDAGRQMHILAVSIWLRYLELFGETIQFPIAGYKGDYIVDIAKQLKVDHQDRFLKPENDVFTNIADVTDEKQKEATIDALINRAKQLLTDDYQLIFNFGIETILADIEEDLAEFGVHYQRWFRESELVESGAITKSIEYLKKQDDVYEQDGALWFKAMKYGDEKDRVIIRANGQHTYFAADIGYFFDKIQRGFDKIIFIFGADHHGYIARMSGILKALGHDANLAEILIVQFAVLYRGKQKVQMSTRAGHFVTLRELRHEVGNDATRFFYIMRKAEQHLDFDLELAKSHSADNPVYYIQYAHARICSVFRQLADKQLTWDQQQGLANLDQLSEPQELALLRSLARYPELIETAANSYAPHLIAHYLQELANYFHTYYNAHQFIVDDQQCRNARLSLISATKQVLVNGLTLLGVSAPEQM